jgi:hypothetical protein
MRIKAILTALAVSAVIFASGQVSFGEPHSLDAGWRFRLGDIPEGQAPTLDDGNWERVSVPHDWSVHAPMNPENASCQGFLPGGIGWYRLGVDIPEKRAGKKVYLHFEGVYNRSDVWLNGHLLGHRPNGYASFTYDATPYVDFGGVNTIAVRVDHSRAADSRWYTGSGIYRNVWIVYSSPVHISEWGVYLYPETATAEKGVLNIETEIENGTTETVALDVEYELTAPDGTTVASSSEHISVPAGGKAVSFAKMEIADPLRWSTDSPSLYTLHTTILKEGERIDGAVTRTGLREFTFDPDRGFALNGEPMKLKGVCVHQDAGVLGAAVPPEVWQQRLKTLRSIGCNAIRTTHNPFMPYFYDLCDELGMLVVDEAFDEWEFPKRKWLDGWNVGTPGFDGAYDFFAEWGERDLADMVRRDRNHPCIIAWSIGNEVDYPNDPYSHPVLDGDESAGFSQPIFGGYDPKAPDANRLGEIAKRLATVVRGIDTSRPVTAGLAGVAMSNRTDYPSALDIAGYNYTENKYGSDHKRYPERVIYGSENRHDYTAWKAVRDNEYISGQFLWTGIDYLGESNPWPARGFGSGAIDLGGFIKPLGWFRKSLWTEEPMVYAGTYPVSRHNVQPTIDAWPVWEYVDGEDIKVVCFANTPFVRLTLNGRQIGEIAARDNEKGFVEWTVPFAEGELTVIGLDAKGNETCRRSIATPGKAHSLRITSDTSSLDGAHKLAILTVEIVDKHGNPVSLAENHITCTITGPARLLGMESGNNFDTSDPTDNVHNAYRGHIKIYIAAEEGTGSVKIEISSSKLKSSHLML